MIPGRENLLDVHEFTQLFDRMKPLMVVEVFFPMNGFKFLALAGIAAIGLASTVPQASGQINIRNRRARMGTTTMRRTTALRMATMGRNGLWAAGLSARVNGSMDRPTSTAR
jgi:hypothetical protein